MMSGRLKAPVLTVDAAEMRKVDPRNAETLFGMWTVFSKCAEAMEEGRRYENLSWRLWNRETFCCNSQASTPAPSTSPVTRPRPRRRTSSTLNRSSSSSSSPPPPPPRSSSSRSTPSRLTRITTDELPELSASVESAVSDREGEDDNDTAIDPVELRSTPLDIGGPAIRRLDSFGGRSRSRGTERHLTPIHLERMFSSIKARKELEPLELSPTSRTVVVRPCTADISRPTMAAPPALSPAAMAPPRGSSRPSPDRPATSSTPAHVQPVPCGTETAAKKNIFMLGGSSGEDESSLDDHMRPMRPHRSALAEGPKPATADRKQTSFKDEVVTRTIRESPHEDSEAITEDEAAAEAAQNGDADEEDEEDDDDDDDDDVLSESAIEDDDDDDDSEWDSVTESGRSSVEEKPLFQRVDSKPNLTSRRSLLTNLLHQSQRADAFAQAAQSTPAPLRRCRTAAAIVTTEADEEADDEAAVADEDDDDAAAAQPGPHPMRKGPDVPRSRPIVMTASTAHPPALSPRTTRLNMLATELTESLRRHLLWERQQKNTTAAAVLKRRHTAHDVARLQEYPQETSSREASKNNSWNHYYFDLGLGEYHQKGW